jgi:UDP-N-acetyl-D-mannosaminuronic acid dehydrogenase
MNITVIGPDYVGLDEATEKADIIAFLVAHNEFKTLKLTENEVVLDFSGIINKI